MRARAAKLVSAIFTSALAGTALAAVSQDAARVADDCLAAPKGETPEGSHWYYRIDHASKRQCWYLRGEGEKLSQAAAPNSSGTAKPAASMAPPSAMQRSVADAHAELPAQTSIDSPRRKDGPAPAMPADQAVNQDNAIGADAQRSVVDTRWLDPSALSSAASPQPATDQLAANIPSRPLPDSPQSDSSQSDSAAAAPPAAAVAPPATADSSQGLPASMPLLLAVMTGALALAGITASLVIKFGGARRPARAHMRRDRIWGSTHNDNIRLSARPDADVVPRRPLPRDLDRAGEPNDRVAEFYAQLSKQARS